MAVRIAIICFLCLATFKASFRTGEAKDWIGCGVQAPGYEPVFRSQKGKRAVIGGDEAKPHSWPWMVWIWQNGNVCGGSLLRVRDDLEESDIVLTAAHCMKDTGKYSVNANGLEAWIGSHKVWKRTGDEEIRKLIKGVVYGKSENYEPDIGLLLLESPVRFTNKIRPICLPQPWDNPPYGQYCVIAGWGRNESKTRKFPDTLQQSLEPVHDDVSCQKAWSGLHTERRICAGGLDGVSGICGGDSGGPLMCADADGRWVVHGIASSTLANICVHPGKPGQFDRVSRYVDWIRAKIWKLSSVVRKK